MNYIEPSHIKALDRPLAPATFRDTEVDQPPKQHANTRPRRAGRLIGLAVVIGLFGALAFGAWGHYAQYSQVAAAAQARSDLVPSVRVATVQPSGGIIAVSLPATTLAFSTANIFARASGYITQRNVDIGTLVQADATTGTFMFTLMQSNVIRTQVFVPQDQAFGLSPGVDAVVHVPEIPDRTFPGKVTRIADALQPGTRTLLTEVDIPNPDGVLTPGIYCTIELQIPRKTPGLSVPADAIIFNRDGLQVAVVENGLAHIRKISVARDLGTEVEARDGVKPGDQVILNPSVDLVEGSKVQVRSETAGPT
jgi:multidrug efflux pump subunit AcrA (membrane-fusion protein)